ncbi:uncharacterized protein LOC132552596 [Ylistrum balloti]|uniref:uncharacterized protein LOC132552596 n=1 Tax=Ylistrum balloti TaxID=509963 RepID=UPI0029059A3C|nr:uncharacterized protein LOC132552596 [Ylistrum balloti]
MAVTRGNICLVLITGFFVNKVESRIFGTTTAAPCDQPALFENCPGDSLPSNSRFDPLIGKFQLSCDATTQRKDHCVILDDDNRTESFRCPENHVLVGRDEQKPVCCQLKGICLTDCFIPNVLYSFKLGFEFEIEEGYALVGKYSYGSCTEDPTIFRIEICKLTEK